MAALAGAVEPDAPVSVPEGAGGSRQGCALTRRRCGGGGAHRAARAGSRRSGRLSPRASPRPPAVWRASLSFRPCPVADSLRQRLRRSRRSHFVGRQRERDLFRETLDAEVLPYHLVYVHGPGGIGKTSLLEEVRAMAEARAFEVARLDARDLSPTPAAVSRAVTGAFADADPEARRVLLID
ncbi:MAG TPA: ATP-binding protein, partial [Bacteroidetes bacterium]|nr:ATP-binding protein [Bacteroidota bacterium]